MNSALFRLNDHRFPSPSVNFYICRYNNIKIIISSRLFAFSTFQSSNKFRTNFIYLFYVICFSGYLFSFIFILFLALCHARIISVQKKIIYRTRTLALFWHAFSPVCYIALISRSVRVEYIASHTLAYHPTIYANLCWEFTQWREFSIRIYRNEISIIRLALLRKSSFCNTIEFLCKSLYKILTNLKKLIFLT